jgi:NAD(P)-dependent dehydrogenase (short-subunit alcohol dehydrogenase family)
MPVTTEFANRVVLVTGASQGIGAATASELAARGARVALVARSTELLNAVTADITTHGAQALAVTADLSDPGQVQAVFAQVADVYGPVDILVNAAGQVANVPFIDMDLATWDAVLNTNLRGLMLCCQAAFRQMRERGGVIINISSLSGVPNVEKFPGLSAYVAAKSGVAGLGEALAVEGAPLGIRVVTVSPGAVDTPMLRLAAPHLKPGMTPTDMARIIAFLAGDDARHLNGTNLDIFSNR